MRGKIVSSTRVVAALIAALLIGLPIATWLDVNALTEANLRRQAADLNSALSSVRAYYAANVVGRVLAAPGVATQVAPNYADIPGAIPLPATLSLELGRVISEGQRDVGYRFVSDHPFRGRAPHILDDFERDALAALRADPSQRPVEYRSRAPAERARVRRADPDGQRLRRVPQQHDPDSPKRDWKVGDVRGIQEVDDHSADRRQSLLVQIPAGLFPFHGAGRARLHRPSAPPERPRSARHNSELGRATSSWLRCR